MPRRPLYTYTSLSLLKRVPPALGKGLETLSFPVEVDLNFLRVFLLVETDNVPSGDEDCDNSSTDRGEDEGTASLIQWLLAGKEAVRGEPMGRSAEGVCDSDKCGFLQKSQLRSKAVL